VTRSPLTVDLALITLLGVVAALLSWRLNVLAASIAVVLLAVAYVVFGVALYVHTRYWIPLVLPVGGAMLMNYASIVTWRAVFEAGRAPPRPSRPFHHRLSQNRQRPAPG